MPQRSIMLIYFLMMAALNGNIPPAIEPDYIPQYNVEEAYES